MKYFFNLKIHGCKIYMIVKGQVLVPEIPDKAGDVLDE